MSEKDELKKKIGTRIRKLRAEKGITGIALAKMSSVSPAYLSEVERGLSNISSEKLSSIADALRVPMQELLAPTNDNSNNTNTINIPIALSKVAEELNFKFSTTMQLYQGKKSLVGRRSSNEETEWGETEWKTFYERVKHYLEE